MKVANPLRGEVELVLGDETLVLRPSFAALVSAEEEVGSLFSLVERVAGGEARLKELAALFWHCLDGKKGGRAAFEDRLIAEGLARLLPVYRTLLARLFGSR